MTMKLFNVDGSPNCFRVRTVIFELGLDVEIVDVALGTTRPPELLAASPGGKVPALVDGDFTLFESRAINAYLASKAPERDLYPADPKRRALVDQWSYWQAIHLGAAMQTVAFERVGRKVFGMGEGDEALAQAKLAETQKFLPVLEQGLAASGSSAGWLVGTSLTLADVAVASTFFLRKPAGISLDGFPQIQRWIDQVEALPSWQRAMPRYVAEVLRGA